jgi:hypothetical protein
MPWNYRDLTLGLPSGSTTGSHGNPGNVFPQLTILALQWQHGSMQTANMTSAHLFTLQPYNFLKGGL